MRHLLQAASAAALLTALMACAQPPAAPAPVAAAPAASVTPAANGLLRAQAANPLTLATPSTQTFDTLAASGTANAWADDSTLNGWYATRQNGGTFTAYRAGTGSDNAGALYSFGVAGTNAVTDRALGSVGSGTPGAITYGVRFVNNTGATVTALNVAYTGEQWRNGGNTTAQRVDFSYQVNATDLTSGTWTDVDTLDFTSLVNTSTLGALDGNAAANRTALSSTITGLSLAPGQEIWLRWVDIDHPGADHGLAVDDLSVSVAGSGPADAAPTVSATTPANNATNVDVASNITLTFSENVTFAPGAVTLACPNGTPRAFTPSNTANTFTLDPIADLPGVVTCTVTVDASKVTDQDGAPNTMAANYSFSFTTLNATPLAISAIQGAAHRSSRVGEVVSTEGIVTAKRANGFYLQSRTPDNDPATSEAIFVFTSSAPTVSVGDVVRVRGTVQEFRAGGASSANLSLTQISGSPTITTLLTGQPLPAATVIGQGGRLPPSSAIAGTAPGGDVENAGYAFDPTRNGLDFYESLEGMLVAVNNAVTTGNTVLFTANDPARVTREVVVLADDGANASVRTPRGGIVLRENDANPERIFLSDALFPGDPSGDVVLPEVGLGARFPGTLSGVLDYDFGEHKIYLTNLPAVQNGSLQRETTTLAAAPARLTVGSFNVENLDALDPQTKFDRLGALIARNLKSPDILVIEEIQDNDGPSGQTTSTAANATWDKLIAAIAAQGGPAYAYRQIDPAFNQDGGEQPGNIRVGFLFNPARVAFVDRPGGNATTATAVQNVNGRPQLTFSPGRIDPTNPAWASSRKPLVGEFLFGTQKVFVVGNHFNSKGGDGPAQGRIQPPVLSSETQRVQQATLVRDFVRSILAVDANANVVVAGDLNDFQFSAPLNILKATPLSALIETLPENERYSYVFDGNAQTLDHIMASPNLRAKLDGFDVVHVNAEFADQDSDHDPQVARFFLNSAPTVGTVQVSPSPAMKNEPVTARAPFSDVDQSGGSFQCAVDYGDGSGFRTGTVSNGACVGPAHTYTQFGTYTVTVRVTDENGGVGTATATQKIQYYFTGFLLGTQNAPAINRWTSPITYLWFSLRGYQGPRPFAPGFPAYRPVDCTTLAPLGPWTQAYASVPAVQYDAASDRYAFAWTDFSMWSGCRELNVRLDDNTDHSAIYRR